MGIPARQGPECGAKYLAPALKWGLAFVASAVMLTVIQPPIGFSALAWVSLVPFILACSPQLRPRYLVPAAYIISLFYWLANLYWVFPITLAGWLAFCLYTAVLWPVVALCLRYCRAKRIPLFLASGVLFVGAERLQGFLLGGFFWRFLAHSQYHNIILIQIADIFGAAGVSFLIAMVNGLLAELILDTRHQMGGSLKSPRLRGDKLAPAEAAGFGDGLLRCKSVFKVSNLLKIGLVGAALVATVSYGRWRIKQSDKFIEQGPLVASLQSNVPQSLKRDDEASDVIFDELLQKSKASAEAGAELIIWPETIVQANLNKGYLIYLDESSQAKLFDRALRGHSKNNAYLLVGATAANVELQGTDYVVAEKYNSAFLYRPDGQQDQKRYDKIHPVLFSEVLPFRKSCPPLFGLLMKFNPYGFDHSIDAGSEYTVFEMTSPRRQKTQVYRFSTIICYEATLPAIVRGFVLDQHGRKQIDWLVNISNDGWFVGFKGQKVYPSTELPQHAAVCVFRAVENRLALVRSVNTGISCLIDSLGRIRDGYIAASANLPITAMERKGMAGWFLDEMPIDKRVTVFSKYGQWLDSCCAVCLLVPIIVPFTIRLLRIIRSIILLRG